MYKPLDEFDVSHLLKEKGLFLKDEQLIVKEISDGNLNVVFRVTSESDKNKSVILKQALPYVRVIGESMPLTLERAGFEAEALILQARLCPGSVPRVHYYDPEMAVIVMDDLSGYMLMRKGLIQGNKYPLFPRHIGKFMAYTLFLTSDLYMDPIEKKLLVKKYINPELCKITEDLVFTEPYYNCPRNRYNPLIVEQVKLLWSDNALRLEVAKLKEGFLTHAQSLVHGDLHTGSIFVTESDTRVFDPEFSFYGPAGFDVGAVLANLCLSCCSQIGHINNETLRKDYMIYLINTFMKVWICFQEDFSNLWDERLAEFMSRTPGYKEYYMARLFSDSLGYAGCKTIRRIVGLAHVADLDSIEDVSVRSKGELMALQIGKELILKRNSVKNIMEMSDIITSIVMKND